MPPIASIKRRDLIAALRRLGFTGPYSGGKHEFMRRRQQVVRLPNPHQGDISAGLLARVLRQAGISADEWDKA